MFPVLAIAAEGMSTQAKRIEGAAQAIARQGAGASGVSNEADTAPSLRVGTLPLGAGIEESMVTLIEAQHAYAANAAVVASADDMLGTLLKTLDD